MLTFSKLYDFENKNDLNKIQLSKTRFVRTGRIFKFLFKQDHTNGWTKKSREAFPDDVDLKTADVANCSVVLHRGVAEVLVSKGANLDRCYRNKPLLHLSLSLGHHHVASLLVEHGADVNMTDSKGETPIFAALSSDSNRAVRMNDD